MFCKYMCNNVQYLPRYAVYVHVLERKKPSSLGSIFLPWNGAVLVTACSTLVPRSSDGGG